MRHLPRAFCILACLIASPVTPHPAASAGVSQITWAAGRARAASGLYFVRIDSEAGSTVRRAVVAR